MQTKKMKFISILLIATILSGCSLNGPINNLMGNQSNAQAVSDTSTIDYANLDSKVLGKTMSANIYLPAGYD